ncbi:SAC domain-containing protein [Scenedesmus sp. NREL 46B-D3]|nr:SAC domain-containing protein [Scenedesmus sp. NREL 46B-D3]
MAAADSTAEKRYRKLLLGVDLTKNFFFSYSYSLAHTLQHNHKQAAAGADQPAAAAAAAAAAAGGGTAPGGPNSSHDSAAEAAAAAAAAAAGWDVYDSSMFVWNAYLTRPLRAAIQSGRWSVPLVYGYWEQRQVSVFGRSLTLTLLARRSRHYAGTRFRKRGLSSQGFVANEVETEQIVDAGIDWATGQPLWSAMVQVRGSVPLFWSQQTTTLSPKPDILLQQFDPVYEKTGAHFCDMRRRYGDPVMALNLLRSKERR